MCKANPPSLAKWIYYARCAVNNSFSRTVRFTESPSRFASIVPKQPLGTSQRESYLTLSENATTKTLSCDSWVSLNLRYLQPVSSLGFQKTNCGTHVNKKLFKQCFLSYEKIRNAGTRYVARETRVLRGNARETTLFDFNGKRGNSIPRNWHFWA